jgi:hypothetical protein
VFALIVPAPLADMSLCSRAIVNRNFANSIRRLASRAVSRQRRGLAFSAIGA